MYRTSKEKVYAGKEISKIHVIVDKQYYFNKCYTIYNFPIEKYISCVLHTNMIVLVMMKYLRKN